ncbi:proteasome subunit alpha [Ornithinimicrobium cryptoxanthini]|uniref:Proteasome subunit alpha n=1 Tax=Ornithinimicrobium cryptoxanthini TaxID=2934161 RepID=A0ABY4YDH4_9MICO|nr:proteasome subunit alpha [Ornithinimicrobium cryptoxanthini]USQ74816.1 proteasome subunit alpha [Ornithinimicrobium cryptoxanthini]
MTMPMYVSPEQLMKDRADFARKGIARGRSVVVASYATGIAFVAENPSRTLHKVSELYDRIGFAGAGKYNEFENLRVAGIRYADMRGYSYDRRDVTARGLANAYTQTLGTIFTQESKPYEVEIAVAQVGSSQQTDQIYRLTYDGSVTEERGFVAMGGVSEPIATALRERWAPDLPLAEVLRVAVEVLAARDEEDPRDLAADDLEVAVLDRRRPRRTFRRLGGPLLDALLDEASATQDVPTQDDPRPGLHDTLTQDLAAVDPDATDAPADTRAGDTTADDTKADGSDGEQDTTNPQTQRED